MKVKFGKIISLPFFRFTFIAVFLAINHDNNDFPQIAAQQSSTCFIVEALYGIEKPSRNKHSEVSYRVIMV